MPMLPWIVALAVALTLLLVGLAVWALRKPAKKSAALPTEWALAPRPVFSTDERRVYRLLREALPHHVLLSKLPLVRFCQPTEPDEVRFWYDLLGSSHVTFAVCSANGRVLAAIDLDTERGNSRRNMQIKQSVLGACRVRYLRCPVDQLPSVAELQLLVPTSGAPSRAPQPTPPRAAPNLNQASSNLSHAVASRRAERTALWQDSSVFQDSFFAPDARDGFATSEFAPMGSTDPSRRAAAAKPPPRDSRFDDDNVHLGDAIVTDSASHSKSARR